MVYTYIGKAISQNLLEKYIWFNNIYFFYVISDDAPISDEEKEKNILQKIIRRLNNIEIKHGYAILDGLVWKYKI